MKKYETKEEKIVTRQECVELVCDLCKRKSKHPEEGAFEWGVTGTEGGKLEWHYTADGDYDSNELDLCYDCANALGKFIENPSKRQQLLALIGRERKE